MAIATDFLQSTHIAFGINPIADAFASTVTSDIVNMENYHSVVFLVYWGVGATGTTTITVEASDDFSGTAVTAIPFRYRNITGGLNAGDTHGALTTATTSGFLTTAGSHQVYAIEVTSKEMGDTGKANIRLKCVEGTDSPILGGILILQRHPRYSDPTATTIS